MNQNKLEIPVSLSINSSHAGDTVLEYILDLSICPVIGELKPSLTQQQRLREFVDQLIEDLDKQ